MNKETWIENANNYNGVLVVWVDQGTDPLLKAANSKGVCFAMSLDFVTAFHMGNTQTFLFVNGIRNASLRWPHTSRIPPKYLEMQAASQEMLTLYTENLKKLNTEYEEAWFWNKKSKLNALRQMISNRKRQRFGPAMNEVKKFDESNILASSTIFNTMKDIVDQKGPSYFLVSMRNANEEEGGGHAICFGLRPDLNATNFPGIFEYFDANLGFFVFGTVNHLSDFFQLDVWTDLYTHPGYNKFEIASYPYPGGR